MELILYGTSDSENVINKTLTEKGAIEFNAKSDMNIVSPELRLRFEDVNLLFSSNYAEIPEFDRLYFIREVHNVSNDVWRLRLECDVLETYKGDILNSLASVNRNIRQGDFQDSTLPIEVKREVDIYNSNVQLSENTKMILSTIRGV